ncbi:MAG: TauD/TfdA dioxygenase family protein, partial [Alphaproteobacteria bacterium]
QLNAIKVALWQHGVLAFRNQIMSPAQQLSFVKQFGEIHYHPHVKGLPEQPEVMEILKREEDLHNFGSGWHTDQMFTPKPANYTCLYAKELPDTGGDTLFACMRNGFRTLSPAMQKLAQTLETENRSFAAQLSGRNQTSAGYFGTGMRTKEATADETLIKHPVVRKHPETGDPVLYVGLHSIRLAGFTEDESKPLLDFWKTHLVQPENTARLRWQPETLAIWDNRLVLHNAINDYPGKRRRMHRITVAGAATQRWTA